MKKNSCVVSAKVERRVTPTAPAPVLRIRNPNPRPMATRVDLPRPADVTPTAPVVSDPDPDNRIMDLRELAVVINHQTGRLIVRCLVAISIIFLIAVCWRLLQ